MILQGAFSLEVYNKIKAAQNFEQLLFYYINFNYSAITSKSISTILSLPKSIFAL